MRIPNVENQVPWDYTVEVRGYEVPLLKPSDVIQDEGGDGARRGGVLWLLRVAVRVLRWFTVGVTDGAELRGIVRRQVRSAVHPDYRGILNGATDAELRAIANKYQACQADWEQRCRQAIQRALTEKYSSVAGQPVAPTPPSPRPTRSVPKAPKMPPAQGNAQRLTRGAPLKVLGGSIPWGSSRPAGAKAVAFGVGGPIDVADAAPSEEEIERERAAWRERRDALLEPVESYDFTEADTGQEAQTA